MLHIANGPEACMCSRDSSGLGASGGTPDIAQVAHWCQTSSWEVTYLQLDAIMVATWCASIRCRERSPERSDTDVWVDCCSFPFGLERARLVAQAN